MHTIRFIALCYWLRLLGGPRVLALGLLGALLTGVVLFGSLIGAIAVSRGPVPRPHHTQQPQREARKVREAQLGALGLRRQQEQPRVVRGWNKVREEQLKQLGLDRQGKAR